MAKFNEVLLSLQFTMSGLHFFYCKLPTANWILPTKFPILVAL